MPKKSPMNSRDVGIYFFLIASKTHRMMLETEVIALTGPPGPVRNAFATATRPSVLMMAEPRPTQKWYQLKSTYIQNGIP